MWHSHCNHRHKSIHLLNFTNMLTHDLMYNPFSNVTACPTPTMSIIISPSHFCPCPASIIEITSSGTSTKSPIPIISTDSQIRDDHLCESKPRIHRMKRGQEKVVNMVRRNDENMECKRMQRSCCKAYQRKTPGFCVPYSATQNKKVGYATKEQHDVHAWTDITLTKNR